MKRTIQYVLGTLLFLTLVGFGKATITHWDSASWPTGLFLLFMPLLIFGVPIVVLEMQMRVLGRVKDRVRANVEAVAKTLFDGPGAVREGYDRTVTNPPAMAAFAGGLDDGKGFTTEGTFRGVRVSSASLASSLTREAGELHHIYSYVAVDLLGLTKPFRIVRDLPGSKIGRVLNASKDVKIGDEAFDAMFAIEGDEDLVRDVLSDESIKNRIFDLQSKVSLVSSETTVGGLTFLISPHGLGCRWPSDLNPTQAAFIRDLLVDMRERILTHENRVAARIGADVAGGRYRVAAIEEVEEQPEEEQAAEARRRGREL